MKQTNAPRPLDHEEANLLLPWYVNGSLSDDEAQRIRRHLYICIACRRELVNLQKLSESVLSTHANDLVPEVSFANLMKQLKSCPGFPNPQPEARGTVRSPIAGRLKSTIQRISLAPAVTAVAVLIILLLVPVMLRENAVSPIPDLAPFRTLAAKDSHYDGGLGRIRVVFSDETDERLRIRLVTSVGGEIVDGPSANGVYVVRVPLSSQLGLREDAVGTAIIALRKDPHVLFAEAALPTADNVDKKR